MSATIHDGCCVIQGDIQHCSRDHTYVYLPTKKKLVSVTTIIKTIYSKKSWDGVDPAIVENAKNRGIAVDQHMTHVITQPLQLRGIPTDVVERVVIAHRLLKEHFDGCRILPQVIVYNLADGIAGTMDFWIDDEAVVDLKCTYSLEASYILQLGAYLEYAPATPRRCGIVHVSPRTYPDGGRWIEYDMDICRGYWRKALEWWKCANEMSQVKYR